MTAPPLDPAAVAQVAAATPGQVDPVTTTPVDPAAPVTPAVPTGTASGSGAETGTASGSGDASEDGGGFTVRLANFTGPFDLLLQLIGKHKLDVTEVALHQVTDEFIAYIRAMGDAWDLDEASEFLLIAATLLDLKAARLLPAADVEDEEDLALLEARDLLFARLLQYKAYKEAAAHIAALEAEGGRRYPRAVTLEPRYAQALPDLVLGVGPDRLLRLAVKAMTPKPVPVVSIDHVHMVRVSVREHAAILTDRLRRAGTATFALLCADCAATLEVVARFLALLELYREGLVAFTQEQALGELTVRWTGPADGDTDLQIDEYAGAPSPTGPTAIEPTGTGPSATGPSAIGPTGTGPTGTGPTGTATGPGPDDRSAHPAGPDRSPAPGPDGSPATDLDGSPATVPDRPTVGSAGDAPAAGGRPQVTGERVAGPGTTEEE
ncbi:segregation and condensation protein A [Micromonospora cathayae]|uniref:Segregation and condensation protein A n=1 Tax=Micromonospora cathayae TaxID=3028804 RepID=A0ABY7ZHJ7_9ACTN|nr:segregation/condensation protein A [Micromonospora sp. HUAS 3]WDZ82405.1 segregation/condensation protein A [Micromonospora sp. HUAS 3]